MSAYVLSNGQRVYPAFVLNDADGGGIVTPPASFRLSDGTQVVGIVLVDEDGNVAAGPRGENLGWSAGLYYDIRSSIGIGNSTSTAALSANILRTCPIYIPRGESIDRVAFNVNIAASAGKLARVGIYAAGADGLPGVLVSDLGTVAIDSTGDKTVTVATSPTAGRWYYLAIVNDESFTAAAFTASVSSPLGQSTVTGTAGLSAFVAHTFGALPDPFPASARALTTPTLAVRAA
jgi:hypothetical protein